MVSQGAQRCLPMRLPFSLSNVILALDFLQIKRFTPMISNMDSQGSSHRLVKLGLQLSRFCGIKRIVNSSWKLFHLEIMIKCQMSCSSKRVSILLLLVSFHHSIPFEHLQQREKVVFRTRLLASSAFSAFKMVPC